MSLSKGKKWLIFVVVLVGLLLTPVVLVVRPATLDRGVELTDVDMDNIANMAAKLVIILNGKEFRDKKSVRITFSEAEKNSLLKMLSKTADMELKKRYSMHGNLSSRKNIFVWRQEKPLPLGILPLRIECALAVNDGVVAVEVKKIKMGAISVPEKFLPELSRRAEVEVNGNKNASKALALFHQIKFPPDGSIELIIDRQAAGFLLRKLLAQ